MQGDINLGIRSDKYKIDNVLFSDGRQLCTQWCVSRRTVQSLWFQVESDVNAIWWSLCLLVSTHLLGMSVYGLWGKAYAHILIERPVTCAFTSPPTWNITDCTGLQLPTSEYMHGLQWSTYLMTLIKIPAQHLCRYFMTRKITKSHHLFW